MVRPTPGDSMIAVYVVHARWNADDLWALQLIAEAHPGKVKFHAQRVDDTGVAAQKCPQALGMRKLPKDDLVDGAVFREKRGLVSSVGRNPA